MAIPWKKYGDMDSIKGSRKDYVRTVVGQEVTWERKRDGSNVSILLHNGELLIFTRNQFAEENVQIRMKKCISDFKEGLIKLLKDRYIIYGEWFRKGKSPAQFEVHDEDSWIAFDLWDIEEGRYLGGLEKRTLFFNNNILFVNFYTITIPKTVEELKLQTNKMIDLAHEKKWEGFVAKWFYKGRMYKIKAKVEQKYPHVKGSWKKKQTPKKVDNRPSLEMSEIRGAIDKVYVEIGNDIFDKKIAMPKIVKAIGVEERKHNKKCRDNMYSIYLDFKNDLEENDKNG